MKLFHSICISKYVIIGGVLVTMLAWSAVDRGFDARPD